MTHDDFCLTPDADPCVVCDLIKRVRMDEQDAIAGLYETDVLEVQEAAFQRGYNEGKTSSQPIVHNTGIELDKIRQYILDKVTSLTVDQTNTLYALYIHFGGK